MAATSVELPATPAPPPRPSAAQSLRDRLVPPFPGSRLWGWLAPIAITLIAGYLRFNRLSVPGGQGKDLATLCNAPNGPKACVFDEVYYTHDAWSLYHHGVELNTTNNGAGYVVHPPLGKWMIALGEWIVRRPQLHQHVRLAFHVRDRRHPRRPDRRENRATDDEIDPARLRRRLIFSLDGLEYVQSRVAMLDIFLMFWTVVGFACLILDRDQVRGRLADRAANNTNERQYGPHTGMRWWLLACGVAVGCACATKWDGAYLIPSFASLAFFWTMGARRAIGVDKPFKATLVRDVAPLISWMGAVPVVVYTASWTGWFLNGPKYAYDREWAKGRGTDFGFIPASLRSLWHYHAEALKFHEQLSSYHAYRENAWGWLFDARPGALLRELPAPTGGRLPHRRPRLRTDDLRPRHPSDLVGLDPGHVLHGLPGRQARLARRRTPAAVPVLLPAVAAPVQAHHVLLLRTAAAAVHQHRDRRHHRLPDRPGNRSRYEDDEEAPSSAAPTC